MRSGYGAATPACSRALDRATDIVSSDVNGQALHATNSSTAVVLCVNEPPDSGPAVSGTVTERDALGWQAS